MDSPLCSPKQWELGFRLLDGNAELALARRDAQFEQLGRAQIRYGKSIISEQQTEKHRLRTEEETGFRRNVGDRKCVPDGGVSEIASR